MITGGALKGDLGGPDATENDDRLRGFRGVAPGRSAGAGRTFTPRANGPELRRLPGWVEIRRREGGSVTTENSFGTRMMRHKHDKAAPQDMTSCNIGEIGGCMIEGRVPAADIHKLLVQRPDGIGLRVLGMPYGSPGMGPETEREAYDGFLIRNDGSTEVFSLRDGLRGRRRGVHVACCRQRL